jgi:hypothetical protein
VIDRAGKIAAWVIGRINYATLIGIIDDLQAETPTATPSRTPAGTR